MSAERLITTMDLELYGKRVDLLEQEVPMLKRVNRDRNFTRAKVERRRTQLEECVARDLSQLDTADRQERTEPLAERVARLKEKLVKVREAMASLPFTRSRCWLLPTSKSP